jgi:two-component system LytT family response regulator
MSTGIRTVIADDEPLALSSLRILLARDPEIELVGQCSSGTEALAALRELLPALVFLDVQMPELDGFDVLEQLGVATPPAVVFVTAHDEYAIRAFDAGALDYLLKPFDDTRFARALARAKEQLVLSGRAQPPVERIAVRNGRQLMFVQVRDIDWIESADYCVDLHVGDRTWSLRRSMSAIESEFERAGFCRVHRSAIVNLARVRALEANASGDMEVLLPNQVRLPLSRRYRSLVQRRLGLREHAG